MARCFLPSRSGGWEIGTRHATDEDGDFIIAAARCFFVESWSSEGQDENGNGGNVDRCGGMDLLDCAPETEAWAVKMARDFAAALVLKHDVVSLAHVLARWRSMPDFGTGDRDADDDAVLGWYAGMQALGHGVGLEDATGVRLEVPDAEAYDGMGYVTTRLMRPCPSMVPA